ncbi:MAG: helicase C-terminal domain-containing protein [Mycetocola sp.]
MNNENKRSFTVTHGMLDVFLPLVVQEKGTGAEARPGQIALAHDILDALRGRTRFSGIAPPGTGKSFAYLSCAALMAAAGNRVLVSTEMLSLQNQLIEDDLPVVVRAMTRHLGIDLRFASFTGVPNYADPGQLLSMTEDLTGGRWAQQGSSRKLTLADLDSARKALEEKFDPSYRPKDSKTASSAVVLRRLTLWGLGEYLDGGYGDRAHMSKAVTDATEEDWSFISATSDERVSTTDLKDFSHKYDEARARALAADIVVANHALLGIEAVRRGGVIMETQSAGTFEHVIVDEAHALPTSIRNAGDGKVAGSSFRDIGSRARKVLNDYDIDKEMSEYAARLDDILSTEVTTHGDRGGVVRVDPSSTGPLSEAFTSEGIRILETTASVFALIVKDERASTNVRTKARAAEQATEKLANALRVAQHVQNEASDWFVARWIERDRKNGSAALRYTPIPVDGLAREALWHKRDENLTPRGVACVSATLPHGFGAQVGVPEPKTYASPFAVALSESAVYIPHCADPGAEGLLNESNRFDTSKHAAWASKHIVELVLANDGRALVVSATNAGAKQYAEDLERALVGTGITVFTQASDRARSLAGFRENERSVLVGVKSYMTGIDVSGEALSLVILDRPPRAAGNVTDDARVERVMRQRGCTKAEAQREVYVADAAALLDQARGRLIRHGEDRGMVAVLDPRINLLWPLWVAEAEQRLYQAPLSEFGTKLARLDDASTWLRSRRLSVEQQATITELERQLAEVTGQLASAA